MDMKRFLELKESVYCGFSGFRSKHENIPKDQALAEYRKMVEEFNQMTGSLKRVGFWYDKLGDSDLPMPIPDYPWDESVRQKVIAYLKNGKVSDCYKGCSTCRICGIYGVGSCDFVDEEYLWPEGLSHYVEKHNIELPKEFVDHIISKY